MLTQQMLLILLDIERFRCSVAALAREDDIYKRLFREASEDDIEINYG